MASDNMPRATEGRGNFLSKATELAKQFQDTGTRALAVYANLNEPSQIKGLFEN